MIGCNECGKESEREFENLCPRCGSGDIYRIEDLVDLRNEEEEVIEYFKSEFIPVQDLLLGFDYLLAKYNKLKKDYQALEKYVFNQD